MVAVLHIANWYPNPWDDVDGNFVKAHFEVFRLVARGRLLNVQVRHDAAKFLRYRRVELGEGQRGYYLLTRISSARVQAMLTTFLLLFVLLRERAWRYDVFHFHIAWPLLAHAHLWRCFFGKPILISEHWSAYHYKFHLPDGSAALRRMRRPFLNGFPVIAVSNALLADIRAFAGGEDFPGYVIPNVVPLRGAKARDVRVPVLFTVNRWAAIKDPMPMLQGLAAAAEAGARFELVIGGYGDKLQEMQTFVKASVLSRRTVLLGKMTKMEIAAQLSRSDAYLFSSQYETFSVACAESLGAGAPIIGPLIPSISEYASAEDWEQVEHRNSVGWEAAIGRFLTRARRGEFDSVEIAARAAARFDAQRIQQAYFMVLEDAGLGIGARSRTNNVVPCA